MKKFAKIFTFVTIACCGLAYALCEIIIPEQTNLFTAKLVEYINKPLGIVCGTTITLGLVGGIIIKLVYDRYKNGIKEQLAQVKDFNANAVVEAKKYYELGCQKHEEAKVLLNGFNTRLDELTDNLVKVCETIPNAKVKALAEDILNGAKSTKEQVVNEIERLNNDYVEALKERVSVEQLNAKINELTEKLERLVEQYGEEQREETTNNERQD